MRNENRDHDDESDQGNDPKHDSGDAKTVRHISLIPRAGEIFRLVVDVGKNGGDGCDETKYGATEEGDDGHNQVAPRPPDRNFLDLHGNVCHGNLHVRMVLGWVLTGRVGVVDHCITADLLIRLISTLHRGIHSSVNKLKSGYKYTLNVSNIYTTSAT